MRALAGAILLLTPGAAWVVGEPSWPVVIYTTILACLGVVLILSDL